MSRPAAAGGCSSWHLCGCSAQRVQHIAHCIFAVVWRLRETEQALRKREDARVGGRPARAGLLALQGGHDGVRSVKQSCGQARRACQKEAIVRRERLRALHDQLLEAKPDRAQLSRRTSVSSWTK